MTKRLPKMIAVVGPTASGKTALALELAKAFGGEIVSADSRQLYKGMEIGADIPPGEWKTIGARKAYVVEGVPHHLMAVRSPKRHMTLAEYRRLAERAIADILRRGRLPILVGGTGLYIQAITENFDIPPVGADNAIRLRLEKESTEALYARLVAGDPAYASRIPAQNRRYIIRALEVIELTGKPFSEQQKARPPKFEVLLLGVQRSREAIYKRINARVDVQMRAGFIEEAKRLGLRYGWNEPSMSALGYPIIAKHLAGELSFEEAVDAIKRDVRRYAKRQITWLRRDARIQWTRGLADAKRRVARFLAAA